MSCLDTGHYLLPFSEIVILKNLEPYLSSHSHLLSFPTIPMLKQLGKWTPNSIPLFPHPNTFYYTQPVQTAPSYPSPLFENCLKIITKPDNGTSNRARRRVIYDDDDGDEDYGYNKELAMLESYTQLVKDEVLLVQATVDKEQVEVLIYKVDYLLVFVMNYSFNNIYFL